MKLSTRLKIGKCLIATIGVVGIVASVVMNDKMMFVGAGLFMLIVAVAMYVDDVTTTAVAREDGKEEQK